MSETSKATILIVEDDPGATLLERRRLEKEGYCVLSATTADEALQRLRSGPVDLILLDYRLQDDKDGLEFYSHVRAAGYRPPVIMVTGFSSEAVLLKAFRAGVRDVVPKSNEYLDYLPEVIAQVLRQVRTENQLVESEARLAAMIDSAKDAIIMVEADGRINLFNPAAERIFGCTAVEAIGQPVSRFLPFARTPSGTLTDSLHLIPAEGEGIRTSGATVPLEVSVAPVQVSDRIYYDFVLRDVSQRRQTEVARLASELQLREIWEKSLDGMRLTDSHGKVCRVNEAYCRMVGKRREEIEGKPFTVVYDEQGRQAQLDNYRGKFFARSFAPIVTKDLFLDNGKRVSFEMTNALLEVPGQERLLLVIFRDVTEQRELEQQLRQMQKMEAIGQLAGGVAHDFNNLLTVISGFGEMLLTSERLDASLRDFVREIRRAGERAATLTRQLLAFSRKQMLQPQVMDLNILVEEAQKMLRRLIGEDIYLTASLDADLGAVKADPGQIEQVIMNLVVNARDAMPKGGHLTIETHNVDLDDGYTRNHVGAKPGRYVLLAVTDTGTGMSEEVKGHLFEPFFTTKEVGKGTGLGLSTVYGIVKQSGGHIEVYSEPKRGTTFKIYLPRVPRAGSVSAAVLPLPTPQGSETILLAEDEEGVRSLIRLALSSYGYNVIEGRHGEEAYEMFRRHPGGVDLLVTDVVMPRMSGRQLADLIHSAKPDIKVLFLSGYTDDAVVRHGLVEAGMPFLQKPFTPTMVVRKVREVLDA